MNRITRRASITLATLAGIGALAVWPTVASAALPKAAVVAGYDDLAPFSIRLDITLVNGYGLGTFTVPAGQRLVIDYVSANAAVAPGGNVSFVLATTFNGSEVEAHLPAVSQGVVLTSTVYAISAPMRVYADPGSTVTVAILSSSPTGGSITGVYGHFVPTP